jgi:VWFA-related protein
MDDKDEGIRTALTLQTLGELAEQLAAIPGSKTIIWITRGVPNWLPYPYGCKDVTFPRGSGTYLAGQCSNECTKWSGPGQCIDYTPFLRHFSAELDRTDTLISSVEETAEGSLPPADRGTSKDTLQQLADLTGGRTYSNGETEKAIAQSLENARARYQLAYDAPAADGKYHKLRVACTRKGVHIDSQRGYFADQP